MERGNSADVPSQAAVSQCHSVTDTAETPCQKVHLAASPVECIVVDMQQCWRTDLLLVITEATLAVDMSKDEWSKTHCCCFPVLKSHSRIH